MIVNQLNGGRHIRHAHAYQHRAKDLLFIDSHLRRDVVEQRAAHPETVSTALARLGAIKLAPIDNKLRAFCHALFDVPGDPLMRLAGHDGPHLRIQLHAIFDFQRLSPLGEHRHDFIGHIADQHGHANRHAALARTAVGGANQRIHCFIQMGVWHHHHMVFRPTQCLHTFAVFGTALVNQVGNGRGADERERLHLRMIDQRFHGVLVALHHVEYAIRQARLLQQVGNHQRSARVQRAGLENKGVTGSNGDGEHPHRHHCREVKWRNTRHYAQRLTHGPVINAGADLLGVITL